MSRLEKLEKRRNQLIKLYEETGRETVYTMIMEMNFEIGKELGD